MSKKNSCILRWSIVKFSTVSHYWIQNMVTFQRGIIQGVEIRLLLAFKLTCQTNQCAKKLTKDKSKLEIA